MLTILTAGPGGQHQQKEFGRPRVGRSTNNFRPETQQNINSDEFSGIMGSNTTDMPPSVLIMKASAPMFCRPIHAHLVRQCVRKRRIKWGPLPNLDGISRTGSPK
jgi:hypothetical protein